MHASMPPVKL